MECIEEYQFVLAYVYKLSVSLHLFINLIAQLDQSGHVVTGFSLGRLQMGGGQVQGNKALIRGGTHKGGHRPYGGDLTLIDYTIN